MGGGVMQRGHLFPLVRKELQRILGGYIRSDALAGGIGRYVVPPALGDRAGVLGSLVLAESALENPDAAGSAAGPGEN